jgi:raffinose/stachyose/melibiose transport system permease protein
VIISAIFIVPMFVIVFGSFKTAAEAQQYNIALPSEWLFENYVYVFNEGKIGVAFVNSVIVTCSTVTICIVFASLAAFIIARRKGKTGKLLYNVFLLGMIAPVQVVTTFGLLKVLGLIGSYWGVILIMTAMQIPWSVFVFSGFIQTVPVTLDEAAYIDGAGPIRIFFQIVLPLLKPVLATCVVSTAMAAWNEFMIPLYFLAPLQSGRCRSRSTISSASIRTTGTMCS